MIVYVVTTAGGTVFRINGTLKAASRIEREFTLLLGERVTVRKETE